MQELSPDEFARILDDDGQLAPKNLTSEEKEKLCLALMMQHARCESMMRCNFCKGTKFFPPGGNFECPYCKGRGMM